MLSLSLVPEVEARREEAAVFVVGWGEGDEISGWSIVVIMDGGKIMQQE